MPARETLLDRTANLWSQQMDRWIESVNLCQNQYERMMNLWMGQMTEAQKEGQKFWKEWMDCCTKGQADWLKTVQTGLKETAELFRFEPPSQGAKG